MRESKEKKVRACTCASIHKSVCICIHSLSVCMYVRAYAHLHVYVNMYLHAVYVVKCLIKFKYTHAHYIPVTLYFVGNISAG